MGRVVTVTVPMPTNGIVNDPRSRQPRVCRVSTNLDTVTDPNRAVPYYDSVDGDSAVANQKHRNFQIALRTGTTYSLYALGVVTSSAKAQVDYKDLTTGGSNDLDDNAWTATSNNASASGTASMDLFLSYPKIGKILGAKAGTHIWAYDPTGVAAFDDAYHSLAYTNIAQGIVHSQDDIAYIPHDNKIAACDNGTWTDAALTLPSEFYITSICEYGNGYIGIAAAPLSGVGRSRVYLWNRSTSLTLVSANLDAKEGVMKVLEELDGELVGILIANDTTRTKSRVTFRRYTGAPGFKRFEEFTATTGVNVLYAAKQKVNNRVYFLMSFYLNGTQREGVWSIAKNEKTGELSVQHERTPYNDTALTASGVLRNFFIIGDFVFIAYVDASSNPQLSKTNHTASYTATATIETVINPGMPPEDLKEKKTLISVGALYDPLPAAGQAVVKARVNGASSYTTVFTETTDSAVKTEPVPIPSGGTYLDTGEEFEFQLNLTGGAVPTYLIYKYEVLESNT